MHSKSATNRLSCFRISLWITATESQAWNKAWIAVTVLVDVRICLFYLFLFGGGGKGGVQGGGRGEWVLIKGLSEDEAWGRRQGDVCGEGGRG